ncbi:MAG: hypothetical protein WAU68_16785 [Vitreimonas sp.]
MIKARTLLIAAAFACFTQLAFADGGEVASPAPDAARPAIGEWVGHVSWNAPIVRYGWTIYPDGTFSSGRLGRGENGGGAWSTRGAHLTLKYSDRVRYEGELRGDVYAGTAYTAEGRALGGFSMSRAVKAPDVADDDGE